MERLDYFIRRLLLVIPTFLGITMLCFAITQFVPGGPVEQLMLQLRGVGAGGEVSQATGAGGAAASEQAAEAERQAFVKHFGFDQPLPVRYWHWLWRWSHRSRRVSQEGHLDRRSCYQALHL